MIHVGTQAYELNAWWDARTDLKRGYKYAIKIDGKLAGTTKRIFFDLKSLTPDTEYEIELLLFNTKNKAVGNKEVVKAKTLPAPPTFNITNPPYSVQVDVAKDQTQKINDAIANTKGILFFPKGKYVCNQLNVNGDCELKFEKGVVLMPKGDE